MLAASENNLVGDKDPQIYLPQVISDLDGRAEDVFKSNLMPSAHKLRLENATLDSFLVERVALVSQAIQRLCDGSH